MKSKREPYISKFNEDISYGKRTLKGGSSCWPLGLPEKRLDANPGHPKIILYRWVLVEIMYTVTYVRWLVHFFVNHNLNDDVLVLVVTFTRVEESVNREGSSDIEVYPSRCVQQFKPWTMIKTDLLTWSFAVYYNTWTVECRVFFGLSCQKRSATNRRDIDTCGSCIRRFNFHVATLISTRWD